MIGIYCLNQSTTHPTTSIIKSNTGFPTESHANFKKSHTIPKAVDILGSIAVMKSTTITISSPM